MSPTRDSVFLLICISLASCASKQSIPESPNLAVNWANAAAEYRALTRQAYRQAGRDLAGKIADASWSALPEQDSAGHLPPAAIFDVDETVVSNAEFQGTFEPPFSEDKLNRWSAENPAVALPGATDFIRQAKASGVAVFFVTNRQCKPSGQARCPQKQIVIDELSEAGVAVEPASVMLAGERPAWSREKGIRRRHIAASYRVIMLFGDDLGDFVDCMRARPLEPCEAGATRLSRHAAVERYAEYWGNGWYVLPNPMYGSWTSMD